MRYMMTMTLVGDEDDHANHNAELSLQSNAEQIFVSVATAGSDLYDFCFVMLLQISPKRQRQNSILHTQLKATFILLAFQEFQFQFMPFHIGPSNITRVAKQYKPQS